MLQMMFGIKFGGKQTGMNDVILDRAWAHAGRAHSRSTLRKCIVAGMALAINFAVFMFM